MAVHLHQSVLRSAWSSVAQIPSVGTVVFYFLAGHAENSTNPGGLSPQRAAMRVRCRVETVTFHVDQNDGEIFASIRLVPIAHAGEEAEAAAGNPAPPEANLVQDVVEKSLSATDAGGGGQFTITNPITRRILPNVAPGQLDPVVNVRDLRGQMWVFSRFFRRKPAYSNNVDRLSLGSWIEFVNTYHLVWRDVVIWIRLVTGDLLLGIRREVERRVPFAAVEEAVAAAEVGEEFEVEFYSKRLLPGFLIAEDVVLAAENFGWAGGIMVRMRRGNGWELGTVAAEAMLNRPWRSLHVIWNNPNVMQEFVNPWLVEII